MTDHEPTSAQGSSTSAQSAPASADAESAPPTETKQSSPSSKTDSADASKGPNGKESKGTKPGTPPKDNERRNGKEKDSQIEEKLKRIAPYVNEERFKTGGPQREKPSDEELAVRMEKIRLNNEKIKERRATVQADEQAFHASQAAERAKSAAQRRIQAGIDEKRAANAKRKMERVGGREWDSFKKGANTGNDGGTNASMHAPVNANATTDENASEAKEGSPTSERGQTRMDAAPIGGETERGRGRGRGGGRARARGRGGGRGRGRSDTESERAPHLKDAKSDDKDTAGWGSGVEEWGTATSVDTPQQTGIAITTDDVDPWGAAPADDPWGADSTPAVDNSQSQMS